MTRPAETRHITQDASLADPETKAYIDIEDFEGILTKALTGGSAADLKYVTNQTSPTYSVGEYSGSLTPYVYSGSYTPADTKFVTAQLTANYNSGGYAGPLG